jgi:hypothetical protein
MISCNLSRKLALLILTVVGLLTPHAVYATAIANSAISFSNLQIVPASGTVVFLDFWTAEAFAQAQNSLGELDQQFSSSFGGVAQANAVVTFATGNANASALNISAAADSHGNIPGATTAQARSAGTPDLFNSFMITGGTGSVDVTLSTQVTGSLNVFTNAFGQQADTDTTFALEVDGTPILFRFDELSIGPSSSNSLSFSQTLSATTTLSFDVPSFLFVEVDSESEVINRVSEPSTVALLLSGLITLASFSRRKT